MGRAFVLARFPTHAAQHLFGEVDGLLIGDGRDGIVPAVEKTKERTDSNDRS